MTIQRLMEGPDEEQPPDGCHHYNSLGEVPWDIQKYWYQRYSIFSKYDQGIWMTDDAWFGVTPEPVANKIAQHMAHSLPSGKGILIDAFAGAGGNAIAFARSGRWNRVYAIEKDAKVLACAKHNAAIYGVEGKISWFLGDCFEIIQKELADVGEFAVIFASPPWGGPGYRSDTIFDLSVMQPYSLTDIYEPFSKLTGDIALYLPRTSDVRQLAKLVSDNKKMTAIHYCMEGASKFAVSMAVVTSHPPKSPHLHLTNGVSSKTMPHAMGSRSGLEEPDPEFESTLAKLTSGHNEGFEFMSRDLDAGEKADDAVNFEDISDGDLAEDEDGGAVQPASQDGLFEEEDAFGGLDDVMDESNPPVSNDENVATEGDGFDDLFGDLPSSPAGQQDEPNDTQQSVLTSGISMSFDFEDDDALPDSSGTLPAVSSQNPDMPAASSQPLFRPVEYNAKDAVRSKEQLLQQALFAMSGSGSANDLPPAPPQNTEELLASLWPKFQRHTVPRFMELLPPKKAHYVGKTPLKPPKAVNPTKVSLELAQDQEKSFRGPQIANKRTQEAEAEQKGLVLVPELEAGEHSSDDDMDLDSDLEGESVGGMTWQDLQILCEDWDVRSLEQLSESEHGDGGIAEASDDDLFGTDKYDWDRDLDYRPSKRRKLGHVEKNLLAVPQFAFPSLDDPELSTSKIAKKVVLDLNDPQLLVDLHQPVPIAKNVRWAGADSKRGTSGTSIKDKLARYNISNDEAYDLLKENHQSKVRSTLGNLTVEHSMPAVRLQWPYYKTKLEKQEARSFHRPALMFATHQPVTFSKPRHTKRKHMKGKDTRTIFESTKDLSLGDNSNVLLLEYSEEYPIMMSNFGMGNRLINYYRRKNMEDNARPKLELGETAVLLPQDKSPFSMFGHIDPGQITPALYNGMYRAPIFKQPAKYSDFLVIRNTTGVGGSEWYLRNIENLYIVGQEFPSIDVPGPHSRKVTTAAKNRLKMISYRRIRRNKPHRISVAEVTKHFPDTTDMQNRQKMKEFMQFSKEHKEWEMRPGEVIPDEEALRNVVKPEDVCLLESMQVGLRHLQDAGFGKEDDEVDDEEAKDGQSLEQQLAPWYTTRSFIHATQGKAMLQLHGEGDPSGRGEAFSFIRTSMKGGFKAVGESVEDKLDAKKLKELGGHSYNVARQQKAYEESIRRIWEAQKTSLSSTIENSDTDMDEEHQDEQDDLFGESRTPRSEAQPHAALGRRDDESMSQFSRFSSNSQTGKVLRITRNIRDRYGNLERVQDVVRDPRVIRQYLKRRHEKEAETMKLSELKPTGDADQDRRAQKRLEEELARLERNKGRRIARDKQKGILTDGAAMSPGSPSSPSTANPKSAGTQRKCANCGQVGHIKTNKKLCPLLNGTMKQENGFTESAFAMGAPPAV